MFVILRMTFVVQSTKARWSRLHLSSQGTTAVTQRLRHPAKVEYRW